MDSPRTAMLGHLDAGAARGVEEMFRAAAARIRTQLVNRVGADVELRAVGTEWLPLARALSRSQQPLAWATFRLEPSGLLGVISIDASLLTRLVGQILGQPPAREQPSQVRPPSRFDLVIARRVAEDVITSIAGLFPEDSPESVVMGEAGAAARVAIGLPRTALVGSTVFELGPSAEPLGQISVVLPSEITRLVAPRMQRRSPESRAGMDRVMVLPVVAVAELRRMNVSLAELRAMKPGQMIDLGPVRDVVVRVGDRPALSGEAGVQNHFRSVRVKGRVEGGAASRRR